MPLKIIYNVYQQESYFDGAALVQSRAAVQSILSLITPKVEKGAFLSESALGFFAEDFIRS